MVQQAPPSFCVGLHHTRAEGGSVPGGCFSRVTLSVKTGEGQFGTAKRSYGMRRMRWLGLARTGLQVWLAAMAYNLRRSWRLLGDAPA
ncbi:MAG TPA: transposase [Roseomonas sp.]